MGVKLQNIMNIPLQKHMVNQIFQNKKYKLHSLNYRIFAPKQTVLSLLSAEVRRRSAFAGAAADKRGKSGQHRALYSREGGICEGTVTEKKTTACRGYEGERSSSKEEGRPAFAEGSESSLKEEGKPAFAKASAGKGEKVG